MEKYKNGKSGVYAYEFEENLIKVIFTRKKSLVYVYTNDSAGIENINHMKKLAQEGSGLNTFINKEVRKKYDRTEQYLWL